VKVHVLNDSIGSVSTKAGNFRIRGVPSGVQQMVFEHRCYLAVQVTIPAEGDVSVALGLPYNPASGRKPGCGDVARHDGHGDLNKNQSCWSVGRLATHLANPTRSPMSNRTRPQAHESGLTHLLSDLFRDARYALRQMRRSPGTTILILFTLAVGIGTGGTLSGVVLNLLLRPPAHVRMRKMSLGP
jgi:hypothetical protein